MKSPNSSAIHSASCRTNLVPLHRRVMDVLYRSAPRHVRALEITGAEALGNLGFSSLRLIGLIVALEDTCGLAAEALLSLNGDTTVDELIAVCLMRNHQPNAPTDPERARAA